MMKIAIIGMGPAGVNVAQTLRNNGCNDIITMFSAEKVPPYSPPALGEYLMTGNEDVLFWRGRNFCEKYNIDCRAGEKIVQVMPEGKKLKTENNEIVDFDYLVIASGSSLYAPVKGSDKKGIYNFKSLSGADEIRKIASETKTGGGGALNWLKRLTNKESKAKTAIIVGGGFIGVEIALCLAKIGIKPTVLGRRGWIIPRLLDPEAAKFVENDLRAKGIEVLLNTQGEEFVGKEYVESLLTTDGKKIKGDIYITATGIKPNIDFIKDTDIEYDQGIIVNEKLQTRYPYIYACGDVAETVDFVSGERKIHGLYPVAIAHGKTVAYNILGRESEYERAINMNSLKDLSFKIIAAGRHEGEEIKYKDENILRKIYVKDNKITGFVLLGDISNSGVYLSLLRKKVDISNFKDKLLSKHFNPGFLAA